MSDDKTVFALCVDDFGQHAGVDASVCELLQLNRISAVSCMSGAPRWASHSAPMLREREACADYGLHFNLTEDFGSRSGSSLSGLILRSYLHRLEPQGLRTMLQTQLDSFENALGRTPDFIDGHQHIHQLPMVRDALLDIVEKRYANIKPWIRNTRPANPGWGGKTRILKYLGGIALHEELNQRRIPTNRDFAGVYGFDTENYAKCFEEWLKFTSSATLIMCHPATMLDAHDPISKQRLIEHSFFSSELYIKMLDRYQVKIERMSSILSAKK
ncbi:ChbG/HpnK family deacetylase [Undibacterium sp. Ren11W]|uniref:ChbG/HpnK family deacetylase n=1 Tax=Undibacterium sp. Ren11W TaxID=3413045 RepID=UPI003BF147C9